MGPDEVGATALAAEATIRAAAQRYVGQLVTPALRRQLEQVAQEQLAELSRKTEVPGYEVDMQITDKGVFLITITWPPQEDL